MKGNFEEINLNVFAGNVFNILNLLHFELKVPYFQGMNLKVGTVEPWLKTTLIRRPPCTEKTKGAFGGAEGAILPPQ